MTSRRRFCPKGHDTFEVGRDSSYRCRRCKLDAKAATRKRAAEIRRREAEAIAAERAAVAAAQEKAAREQTARLEQEAVRRRETGVPNSAPGRRRHRSRGEVGAAVRRDARHDRGPPRPMPMGGQDNGDYLGACTRRTASVYCWGHNRQLDRESAAAADEGGEAAQSELSTWRDGQQPDSEGERDAWPWEKEGPSQPTGPFAHPGAARLRWLTPASSRSGKSSRKGTGRRTCQCYSEEDR